MEVSTSTGWKQTKMVRLFFVFSMKVVMCGTTTELLRAT